MKQLSREGFQLARDYLVNYARPLEQALFACHFEGAGPETALAELAAFQNDDGGFGHALEPDFRTPTSSALATGLGLQLLRELDIPAEHPLVKRAVHYLLTTLDQPTHTWRVVPLDTNQYPHAPWWHDQDGSLADRFEQFLIIPRGLLVGLLSHYSALVPPDWLEDITADTISHIESAMKIVSGGGSVLEYTIGLAESKNLPPHYVERLKRVIFTVIPESVVRDPAKWDTYCITPLKVVSSINSLGASLIWREIQQHLDYQVDHQSPEGCWEPSWSWMGSYPENWEQARVEWCGHLTLDTLNKMKAFGRIEGINWDMHAGSCTL